MGRNLSLTRYQQKQALDLRSKHVPIVQVAELLGVNRGVIQRFDVKNKQLEQPSPSPIGSFDPIGPLDKLLSQAKGLNFEQFWDLLGRPTKHGKELGVLSYERNLIDVLTKAKHVAIVKPVGCGITEFCLRFILWKTMTSNEWADKQVAIIVGPNQGLANRIIGRIRKLLAKHDVYFDSAKSYITIGATELFSVPSHNIDALRSLESPACIYFSEADFFPTMSDIRETSERYISKSNPTIILESTIGSVNGLLSQIWQEEPCLYERVMINYLDALNEGMYLPAEIEKAKHSRSFNRELLCDFSAAAVGNTFPAEWVDRAFQGPYNPEQCTSYYLGIDSGWSPAKCGVTLVGSDSRGMKYVIISDEYSQSEDEMLELIMSLYNMYNVRNVFVDASDKRFIKRLKGFTRDRPDYEDHIKYLKQEKMLNEYNPLRNFMSIVPVWFTTQSSKEMLSYTRLVLEQDSIRIPEVCQTLKNALYSAQDESGTLLKGPLSHGKGSDCLDSFRLCLWGMDN